MKDAGLVSAHCLLVASMVATVSGHRFLTPFLLVVSFVAIVIAIWRGEP